MSTRIIKLQHKIYVINIEIKNDYNTIIDTIRESIYLTPEEMDKYTIQFKDSEDDYNNLDEDTFEDAFNSEDWRTELNENEDEKNNLNNEKKKEILEKVNKKEGDMKTEFIKIMNEKIKENNKKWEKKYGELKQKYLNEIKNRDNIHKSNISEIMQNMSSYVDNVIESKVDDYNKNIKNEFKSYIQNSTNDFKNADENLKNNVNNLKKIYNDIKDDVDKSKMSFVDILKQSGIQK